MNWYKTAQLIDTQERSQKLKQYQDIGHGLGTNVDKSVLWIIYPDGSMDTNPAYSNGIWVTHGLVWGHETADNSYVGRFDGDTKQLSIRSPRRDGKVPSFVYKKLHDTFGGDIDIVEFGSFFKSFDTSTSLVKIAQLSGEWWIMDGTPMYADSDYGAMGHEAYVLDYARSAVASHFNFSFEGYEEWDTTKQKIVSEYFDTELDESQQANLLQKYGVYDKDGLIEQVPYNSDIFDNIAIENGIDKELLDIADGTMDSRLYGMKEWGWKRVAGDNVQTWTLTPSDLGDIGSGIYEIMGELPEEDDPTVNIEVLATKKVYYDVPLSVIDTLKPQQVAEYGAGYSAYKYI